MKIFYFKCSRRKVSQHSTFVFDVPEKIPTIFVYIPHIFDENSGLEKMNNFSKFSSFRTFPLNSVQKTNFVASLRFSIHSKTTISIVHRCFDIFSPLLYMYRLHPAGAFSKLARARYVILLVARFLPADAICLSAYAFPVRVGAIF